MMIAADQAARLWHPWLRTQRLIRVILGIRWNAEEWPIVKEGLRKALAERSRIERAGWFNWVWLIAASLSP